MVQAKPMECQVEKDLFFSYAVYRALKTRTRIEILAEIGKNFKGNDIRQLCRLVQLVFPNENLYQLMNKMNFRKTGLFSIQPVNKVNMRIHFHIDMAFTEIKKLVRPNYWDIFYKYHLEEGNTIKKISTEKGVTYQRIRQVLQVAEKKLKFKKYTFNTFREFFEEIFKRKDKITFSELAEYGFIHIGSNEEELKRALKMINLLFDTEYHYLNGTIYMWDPTTKVEEIIDGFLIEAIGSTTMVSVGNLREKIEESANGLTEEKLKTVLESERLLYIKDFEYVLIKKNKPNHLDICRWILFNLKKPIHHSLVHEIFCKYKGNNPKPYTTKATLDRGQNVGIIRTGRGTFGLKELAIHS